MSRKLNIFILFLITVLCMLFPENIKNNPTLVIKREECNGMMNSLDCDVLIEKKIGDEYILYKEYIRLLSSFLSKHHNQENSSYHCILHVL